MHSNNKFLTFLIGTPIVLSLTIGTVLAQARLTNQSKVFINGIGSIRVGMTVAQASQAAGTRLVREGGYQGDSCYYVKPQCNPKGVAFMVTNGRISRLDVHNNRYITTLKGAKIGDSESRIKSLYLGQIKVTPHEYTSPQGHYLTFMPKDRSDRNYRLVFETDGKRVTQFRAGKLPEVEYVEGCS